jgi:hypothetical protein
MARSAGILTSILPATVLIADRNQADQVVQEQQSAASGLGKERETSDRAI